MTILSSGLETDDYNSPGWVHIYNRNIDLLENDLLKLSALLDVNLEGIQDGDSLVWNSTTSKWEIKTA